MTDRIALDIETVSTVDDPDFGEPSHWLPFAIALGHRDDRGDIEVEVLFREDSTLQAEAQLLNRVIDWINDRTEPHSREIITYNGRSYDFPILKHRAYQVADGEPGSNAVERLYLLLKSSEHCDLMKDMIDEKGYHVSLDTALDEHVIDATEAMWMGDKIDGSDMPGMGLELMSDRDNPELKAAVEAYAASDVRPLFELRDKLRGHTEQLTK